MYPPARISSAGIDQYMVTYTISTFQQVSALEQLDFGTSGSAACASLYVILLTLCALNS
jgi:hypothetical protein